MEKKTQTIKTYNQSAVELARKFDKIGVRVADIEETFALIKKENPKVLELGCGNGRDAQEIVKRTNDYCGMDISEELIRLANEKVPGARFELGDISAASFPEEVDIVFAFASLIHLTKEECKTVLSKLRNSMNTGGVIRISVKYNPVYKEITQDDEFGTRTYYLYSQEDIEELASEFTIIKLEIVEGINTQWLETILQK